MSDIPRAPKPVGRPPNKEGPHPRSAVTLYPTVMNAIIDTAAYLGTKPPVLLKAIIHQWYLDGALPVDPDVSTRHGFLKALAEQETEVSHG